MKRATYRLAALAAVCAATVLTATAGLRVCGRCGHESADGAIVCANCAAALPPAAAEDPATAELDAEARPSEIAIAGVRVEEELTLARKYLAEGAPEVARLYALNALALDLLSDRTQDPARTARIADFVKSCRAAGAVIARQCSDCGGTGRQIATMSGLNGSVIPRAMHGRNCAPCGGRGFVEAPGTVNEQKQARGRALKNYTTLQQGRQYAQVGNAWIPAAMRDGLSVRQTAALLTATAAPCDACLGFGREDCSDCKGLGTVPCSARGCVKGWVDEKQKGQLIKGTMKRTVRCRICGGRGFGTCESCRGNGSELCERCQGLGERAVCLTCGGQGYGPCRRCRGVGAYRGAPCLECGGQGVALCRACSGDGHKR